MPLGPLAIAGISAGIGLGQGLLQTQQQKKQNELDRDFQLGVMNTMRQWAIQDRDYENRWNSPDQQMRRLKEAGLNPALLYGHGVQAAANTRQSAGQAPNQQAPLTNLKGVSEAADQYLQNSQLVEATENLKEQRNLLIADQTYRAAQTMNTLQNTKGAKLEYNLAKDIYDQTVLKSKLENSLIMSNIEQSQANIGFKLAETKHEALKQLKTIAETSKVEKDKELAHEILNNTKLQSRILEAQIKLWEAGINPNSNNYISELYKLLVMSWHEWKRLKEKGGKSIYDEKPTDDYNVADPKF